MTSVKNNIEYYYSLYPNRSAFVEYLHIEQSYSDDEDERIPVNLVICLQPNVNGEGNKIRLEFYDITDLHINPGLFPFTLPLLEIFDIKSHQLEGIRYKVTETEWEVISFFCGSFSVTADP